MSEILTAEEYLIHFEAVLDKIQRGYPFSEHVIAMEDHDASLRAKLAATEERAAENKHYMDAVAEALHPQKPSSGWTYVPGQLAGMVADLRDEREELQAKLALYKSSATELAECLRAHWKCPDQDTMTMLCAAIVGGIAEEWAKNPPENGIAHSAVWPEAGAIEIQIRKVGGKSAAQSLIEIGEENARLREALKVMIDDFESAEITHGKSPWTEHILKRGYDALLKVSEILKENRL